MTTISGDVFNEKEELLAQGTFSFYNFDTPLLKQWNQKDGEAGITGREDGEITEDQEEILKITKDKYEVAKGIIDALGGKANIESITCCATRLRVTVWI